LFNDFFLIFFFQRRLHTLVRITLKIYSILKRKTNLYIKKFRDIYKKAVESYRKAVESYQNAEKAYNNAIQVYNKFSLNKLN
jgi:vacuolar-type H+-ATPase subunit D/Vma8